MDKKKLNTTNNLSGGTKGKALPKKGYLGASGPSDGATTTKIIARGHASSAAEYVLFWLYADIDPKDENCNHTIRELQSVISTMHAFNDMNECANVLHTIKNQKVFMVTSGSLGQQILPRIHHMSQLTAVFIFCSDPSKYESLRTPYPKVQGIFTDIRMICDSLKRAFRQSDEESTDIGLVSASDISGGLGHLDPSFMYTQLIKEILFELEYSNKDRDEFNTFCRQRYSGKRDDMQMVERFKTEYDQHTPVWWYSNDSFLYPLLNNALREQEADIIIKMGFFIHDLHREIEQFHRDQRKKISQVFTVYRGQGLLVERFERLRKSKLLSFNNFVSTTLEKSVTKLFIDRALADPKNVAILYTITVDPSISSAPFANIEKLSYYGSSEREILFSMHTIFRIGDIKQDNNETRLWHVQLTLTSDNDPQLNKLSERMRVEIGGSSPSYRLGALMIKLGKFDKAEVLYKQLLEQTPDENEKANLYYQLGYINDKQGYHDQALKYYQNALTIYSENLSPNHQNIATCYNNIGLAYDNKKEYKKALSYYQKALEIYQQTATDNDSNIGYCYNSIGLVYNTLGDYPQALSFCRRAIDILEKSLPSNHPTLATSYNNIGLVYGNMKKYTDAKSAYKRAIDIGKIALPPDHQDLEAYRKNLETVRNK